jgi:hypothetical protein
MVEVKLRIIKETSVLGNESYHLMFGDTYIPGSSCSTIETANELFESFKDRVHTPMKEEVRSEIIQISGKE